MIFRYVKAAKHIWDPCCHLAQKLTADLSSLLPYHDKLECLSLPLASALIQYLQSRLEHTRVEPHTGLYSNGRLSVFMLSTILLSVAMPKVIMVSVSILYFVMWCVILLGVVMLCHYTEGCYDDCHHAECRYAECRGTIFSLYKTIVNL